MVELSAHNALTLAARTFTWGQRTYVMAVLNITPNSFSGDGLVNATDIVSRALIQARAAAAAGADILDIGGEATFPGAPPVSLEEEQARVVPVIRAVVRELDLPVSIDTFHAETAAAALDAGAHIVNSIWGLWTPEGTWNEPLAQVVATRQVPFVLTHNRRARPAVSSIGAHYATVAYDDLLTEMINELQDQIAYAIEHGIRREQIIIDPGIGFGKTPAQNVIILRRMAELRTLNLPILIGASRKSFIGHVLGVPAEQRDAGTAAVTALAIQRGADIIRVHNVPLNAQVAWMSDALVR